MEFFSTVDFLICMIVGVVVGLLAWQVMKGSRLGLIGSILAGLVGGGIGGWLFDVLDFMDIGDVLDPVIAALVGASVLLTIAFLLWRPQSTVS
jgi:uncharacterized membrane protein YeaQ/YmgE (transglycosylase-associated protein family)